MAMFITPATAFALWAVTVHTSLAILERDSQRHETAIEKLTENQAYVIRILDRLETRVALYHAQTDGNQDSHKKAP